MKTIYFNIQSKGGAGKSMLTYFQAMKNESNHKVLFIDLDSSTRTSSRQLDFLKSHGRLAEISLLNALKKIEREKMLSILEELNQLTAFDEYYLDFGAPESEQLANLFSMDYSAQELKDLENELGAKFVFNIVIAGGAAYLSSFEYFQSICALLAGFFEINVFVNQYTFYNHEQLIDEVRRFACEAVKPAVNVKLFGDLHPDRYSTIQIIEKIMAGKGIADYHSFSSRTIVKREIAKV